MKRTLPAAAVVALFLSLLAGGRSDAAKPGKDGFIPLFNGKNLNGFYTFLGSQGRNKDPNRVFTVHDGVIHVTGKEAGYFATNRDYENYHLRFQMRWPLPKPKSGQRNAGCLVHLVGPDKIWPKSFECQLQEGNIGDFWLVDGTTITRHDGKPQTGGNIKKIRNGEKPTGLWNTVEILCSGDTIVHRVNGIEVNRGTKASHHRGKILFQSEGSELFYRDIEIRPLPPGDDCCSE